MIKMTDWKDILKEEEIFQDTRKNIRAKGRAGKDLPEETIEIIIECIEKVLEEPGANPQWKWFAKQPFEGKVITCYKDKTGKSLGSGEGTWAGPTSSISWSTIHRLLTEEFGARIDGANEGNCGKDGRLGKYGGKCGGPTALGLGAGFIIYQQNAKMIFGPPDPEPDPKKPRQIPLNPTPEPEPELKPGAKFIMTEHGKVPASDDWRENLQRIKAKRRKAAPKKAKRRLPESRRGGASGYGGALGGKRLDTLRGSTGIRVCEQCGHNRAKRNMTVDSETGANICKYCIRANEYAERKGKAKHGAGHTSRETGRDKGAGNWSKGDKT